MSVVSLLLVSLLSESSSNFLVAKRNSVGYLRGASFSLAYFSLLGGSFWFVKDTAQREIRGSPALQGTRQEGSSLEQESSWRGRAGCSGGWGGIPKVLGSKQSAETASLQHRSLEC